MRRALQRIEKTHIMQDRPSRDIWKAHSHSGEPVPDIFVKLMAMQDRPCQRWLKGSQPCMFACPYLGLHERNYEFLHECLFRSVCVCLSLSVCMFVYREVCMHVCACVRVCLHPVVFMMRPSKGKARVSVSRAWPAHKAKVIRPPALNPRLILSRWNYRSF